jgi:ABC-type hemin transport system ATPase subunit
LNLGQQSGLCHHRYKFTLLGAFGHELNDASCLSEQCVVFPAAYVGACMKARSALSNDNVARLYYLTTVELHAEPF